MFSCQPINGLTCPKLETYNERMTDYKKPLEPRFTPKWLGARLSEQESRLKFAGVSLARIFRASGISPTTWQRWKSGDNSPRVDKLALLEREIDRAIAKTSKTE